jgi:hypothetical protein
LNLGKLEYIPKADYKVLANRIEEIITGAQNSLFPVVPDEIEELAQSFAKQISKEKIFSPNKGKAISKEVDSNYQNVNLDSLEQTESKDIGGEWLVKQAFDKLGIPDILKSVGIDKKQVEIAQLLLKAKLIHPSSELETERWLNENSAAIELYKEVEPVSRYKLY